MGRRNMQQNDDCDGRTDEDFVAVATNCGVGACAREGQRVCREGQVVDTCEAGQAAENDATCDNQDDDCDGVRDEDFVSEVTTCGEGVCAAEGRTACVDGVLGNTCQPGQAGDADATCDGRDDGCNDRQ